jgi:hypothetical protein
MLESVSRNIRIQIWPSIKLTILWMRFQCLTLQVPLILNKIYSKIFWNVTENSYCVVSWVRNICILLVMKHKTEIFHITTIESLQAMLPVSKLQYCTYTHCNWNGVFTFVDIRCTVILGRCLYVYVVYHSHPQAPDFSLPLSSQMSHSFKPDCNMS